jgi:HPt (histidine-containing phosphotransfer) domain-containing protein
MLTLRKRPSVRLPAEGSTSTGSPAAPSAGVTVLDAAALASLRELDPKGANRLLERVVKAFETSLERLLPQLRDARDKGDPVGIRHVAHTLKSSSASIGALRLSQICAEVEASARLGELEGMAARVDALCAEVESVRPALEQLLHTP